MLGSNGSFDDATAQNPTWAAPVNLGGQQENCSLQVTVSDGQGLSQIGSYQQTVDFVLPPFIQVVAPNGGEVWKILGIEDIEWISNITGKVNIFISRNGGAKWKLLKSKTANDESHAWKVTKPATTSARIKVCRVKKPLLCDVSDADFTIEP